MIKNTNATVMGSELTHVKRCILSGSLNGKGIYTKLCKKWLESFMYSGRALLVSSGTSALEMAAIVANIQLGDEIVVPSYTYVTTVNSFVLRGAIPVFVDLDYATMNINASLIEAAITSKTRAIVPVHYGGVACDMDIIMQTAKERNLIVCEDATMACCSTFNKRMLGTIGHLGCISFQEKKNLTAGGQGGALLVNDPSLIEHAEILYEHGTNRGRFLRGEVERYEWLGLGLNATLSEVQAAFLFGQIEAVDRINERRLLLWQRYYTALTSLSEKGYINLPLIPNNTTHNANIFWIQVCDVSQRSSLLRHLSGANIQGHPQFMPFHLSPFGRKYGRFSGEDSVTSLAVSQILLLPIHMALSDEDQNFVIDTIISFWRDRSHSST
ncbi:uncharacterized protein N7506_005715 [Penicillium brevicompactum]|uniref:uncharacterized protein n=1 Tax=Penicillium brevicompactum TaxID=5074 RepID=UPI002540904B|nr:uncharacterized protein N7506_005715 [Penicillium brevicompactum]KAJ5335779.1 hypothetical protein N7506_005715 [Penicillium brevicompactum]